MNSFLSTITQRNSAIFTLSLGIVIGYIVARYSSVSRSISNDQHFLLSVTLKFKSSAEKNTFKKCFEPLADYVRLHEPKTLSYAYYDSDKDPNQGYIFERYVDKAAYLDIHKKSKDFIEFREKLSQMTAAGEVTIDGHSYFETNLGFIN